MSNDLPDFLSDEPSSTPNASAAAPPQGQTPEGAAPAGQPEGAGAQPPPAAAPAAPEAHTVPLPTFLEMRDELSASKKEAKELREWRQQQEAKARSQPPPPAPNRDEDPDGYEAHQQAVIDARLYEQRREISRRFAVLQHGEETVSRAFEWAANRCDEDKFFNGKVRSHEDPLGFVVAEWQREQMLADTTPADFAAFQAWKAAQAPGAQPGGQPSAQAAAPAAPVKPTAPRQSLAAGPSAGASAGPEARDGEAQFDAMFR